MNQYINYILNRDFRIILKKKKDKVGLFLFLC